MYGWNRECKRDAGVEKGNRRVDYWRTRRRVGEQLEAGVSGKFEGSRLLDSFLRKAASRIPIPPLPENLY